ncbi:MAG: hypothetical protein ABI446_06490, partial [Gemmatimonadaceae bacterium]
MSERSSDCMLMLDPDTGWVSALTYRRFAGAACTTSDVISLWNLITEFTDANCESIMRVAFGGMSPYEYSPYTPGSE